MTKQYIYSVVLCFCVFVAVAQNKTAQLQLIQNPDKMRLERESFTYADTLQLLNQLKGYISEFQQEGYLLSSVASVTPLSDSVISVYIFVGDQFKWAKLSTNGLPTSLVRKSGYRKRDFYQTPFKPKRVSRFVDKILTVSQNSGYPFAWMAFDSVKISEQEITANIAYDPGPLIKFDSVNVIGNVNVNNKWLQVYLGITQGSPFDQSVVDQIEKKINQLHFIRLKASPYITFQNEQAVAHIEVEKVKSNSIDGIIGFLPNEQEDGSMLITGQFDMQLNNLFNSGKSLDVHWQSLKPRSQLLELSYRHRNLFRSPLHFQSLFYLLKEDTTFINRKAQLEFLYTPSDHAIGFFTRFESSRKLGEVTPDASLQDLADFNITYYGLNHTFNTIDLGRVPRGLTTYIEAAVGDKSIRNISNLPPDLRQNLDERSIQYLLRGKVQYLYPLSRSIGLAAGMSGAKIFNNNVFINDLFRVGGLTSLRGFNENFFFASEYVVSNLELRLYYEPQSYLFIFYDQSYLYYNLQNAKFEDYPLGIGAGINFKTKGGLLTLAYAVGKSNDQDLSLSLSKVHFGYVAKF